MDSAKFMASSLSNFVDNLAEGIQEIICKDCDVSFDMKVSRAIL